MRETDRSVDYRVRVQATRGCDVPRFVAERPVRDVPAAAMVQSVLLQGLRR